jgi:CRISPR system Cascade subunit CasB
VNTEKINSFVYRLYKLDNPPSNTAALARLRHGIGDSFDDVSPDLPPWLLDCIEDPKQIGKFALVGSLFALHRLPAQHETMGRSFARIKGSDSLEKRFISLLDAQENELIQRLREIIGLAKSQEVPIDYGSLLHDILNWENPDQAVQFHWAREYWSDSALYESLKQIVESDWKNEQALLKSKSKQEQELKHNKLQAMIFSKYLQGLRENRAALAHLRRGLGKPQGTIDMLPYIAPFLPDDRRENYAYFFMASLFGTHPLFTEQKYHDIGQIFRLLGEKKASKEATQNLQRRFTALLDANSMDLGHHLRQVISAASSAKPEIAVNYRQLLLDLIDWDSPKKHIQKRWAKSFFFDPKFIG